MGEGRWVGTGWLSESPPACLIGQTVAAQSMFPDRKLPVAPEARPRPQPPYCVRSVHGSKRLRGYERRLWREAAGPLTALPLPAG